MVTSYFDKISVMEAVNPGRSRPVILIKISSVYFVVAIYRLQKYVNKSLSAIFSAFFFLDEKDDFMLYNIFFEKKSWS